MKEKNYEISAQYMRDLKKLLEKKKISKYDIAHASFRKNNAYWIIKSVNKIDLKIFEDNRISSMQSASANELRPLANIGCPNKKADGGRVNFANGEDLVACAIKGAEKLQNYIASKQKNLENPYSEDYGNPYTKDLPSGDTMGTGDFR